MIGAALFYRLLSEPIPLWQGMLMLLLFTVVTFVILGVGGYFGLRLIASALNSHRDNWESSVSVLGLAIDPRDGGVRKAFAGEIDGRAVRVEHYAVPTGKYSADHYAAIEVKLSAPVDLSFELKKPEMLYQKVVEAFDGARETGHGPLDKAFRISSTDLQQLVRMLEVELPGGENPTLLNDLLAAAKRHTRVIVTDTAVTLGASVEHGPEPLHEALAKASYLASRIERAATTAKQVKPG